MAGFIWVTPPEQAFPEMADAFTMRITAATYAVMQSTAPQAEAWMKSNAPWSDVTGNARKTLHAEPYLTNQHAGITMDHGMWYGKYLELKNAGRYAIVAPAVDVFFAQIVRTLRELFRS